ncbi:MAG: hypothetical protein AB9869_04765 [Verrucomicrobiia bacterium]
MKTCNKGHVAIAFRRELKRCPLCEARLELAQTKRDLDAEAQELRQSVRRLNLELFSTESRR